MLQQKSLIHHIKKGFNTTLKNVIVQYTVTQITTTPTLEKLNDLVITNYNIIYNNIYFI